MNLYILIEEDTDIENWINKGQDLKNKEKMYSHLLITYYPIIKMTN